MPPPQTFKTLTSLSFPFLTNLISLLPGFSISMALTILPVPSVNQVLPVLPFQSLSNLWLHFFPMTPAPLLSPSSRCQVIKFILRFLQWHGWKASIVMPAHSSLQMALYRALNYNENNVYWAGSHDEGSKLDKILETCFKQNSLPHKKANCAQWDRKIELWEWPLYSGQFLALHSPLAF